MLSYEELTFPEVEALPRDLPLVIPLGNRQEYSDEGLRSALGLSEWCWMPSVPYGFPSPDPVLGALAVAPQVLERLLGSLLAILAEDGFTRVHLVSCHGPAGSLPVVSVPGRPGAWPPCPPAGRVALISTGHTEQHGLHLPLATDTLIIEALAARVEGLRPHRVWRLPPWPYGVSTHRRQYPGTLSADPRAWEDFWVEVVGCLYRMGFRCVYLINGHGGNHSFLVNAVKFCGERWPDAFVATSFLHTSSGRAAAELARLRASSLMGHACELETSYLLALRPDLVRLERVVDEEDFISTPSYRMDWIEAGPLVANPPWTDDTRTGTLGAPSRASAAKGQAWLAAAAEEMAGHVDEILEQRERRRQRQAQGWVEGAWRGHQGKDSRPRSRLD